MVNKWALTIPALSGEEERHAYVYVPDWAGRAPERRFSVLYMFDGHNVFFDKDATYGTSWRMADYLDADGVPLIVAAVECSHAPNNARLSEYSPYTFDDAKFGHVVGRGRQTMDWFIQQFKPQIDARFPTLPDREHTFIAGSSMGGLMSLYALLAHNDVFSRAAALSPSLWVDPAQLEGLAVRARLRPGSVLYMDYGQQELQNHRGMEFMLRDIANAVLARKVLLNFRIVPNGTHNESSWGRQLPFFIHTLLYGIE